MSASPNGRNRAVTDFDWSSLGRVAPDALVEPRLVLHHAGQLAAAAGASLIPPRPDDSHPNLGWEPDARALAGRSIEAAGCVRAALRPQDLTLLVLDGDGSALESIALPGHTLGNALRELHSAIERAGGHDIETTLALPGYELPHHPVTTDAPFPALAKMQEAWSELAAWFAAGHAALSTLRSREPGASEVRCWPHHFDIATLIVHDSDDDGRATATIGAGLSPGDESYAEPYWYVSPWPYPEGGELPPLESGAHWHREGFTAAILPASRLLGASDREGAFEAYLTSAMETSAAIHDDPASES
jgi:hypothetical protein